MTEQPDHEEFAALAADLVAKAKAEEARRQRKEKLNGDDKEKLNGNGPEEPRSDILPPELRDYELSEDGVALAFEHRYEQELRFCHGPNRWHRWDGIRWKPEHTSLAYHWIRELARQMKPAAEKPQDKIAFGKATFAAGVERFARAARVFAVEPDLFDRDPWLLGTPGGTVDLRTGAIGPPDPNDFITKLTSVAPASPATPHPLWDKFLAECTSADEELQRYLWKIAGYCLTGDASEEALWFIFGPGGNGKGTFVGAIANVLGDYATPADMATFTASKYDRHPAEIAKLAGARLVTATETERGRTWAWSRIKEMTGNARPLSAHFMRANWFDFRVTFKLIFDGNHKPRLPSTDDATARRMNLIPFRFKPTALDDTLKEALVAEYPAILRWMIGGCLAWQADGLERPDCVAVATQNYLEEQDQFALWLSDECTTNPTSSATHRALFGSWTAWCLHNGELPGTAAEWRQRMIESRFKPARLGEQGDRGWRGIELRAQESRPQESAPDRWDDR